MAVCVIMWQPTPKTADVTVTKIAGFRVRILMNPWFFRIFGIHSFYTTATLLNIWICMKQWTDAADGGCGGGLDFAPPWPCNAAIRSVPLEGRHNLDTESSAIV